MPGAGLCRLTVLLAAVGGCLATINDASEPCSLFNSKTGCKEGGGAEEGYVLKSLGGATIPNSKDEINIRLPGSDVVSQELPAAVELARQRSQLGASDKELKKSLADEVNMATTKAVVERVDVLFGELKATEEKLEGDKTLADKRYVDETETCKVSKDKHENEENKLKDAKARTTEREAALTVATGRGLSVAVAKASLDAAKKVTEQATADVAVAKAKLDRQTAFVAASLSELDARKALLKSFAAQKTTVEAKLDEMNSKTKPYVGDEEKWNADVQNLRETMKASFTLALAVDAKAVTCAGGCSKQSELECSNCRNCKYEQNHCVVEKRSVMFAEVCAAKSAAKSAGAASTGVGHLKMYKKLDEYVGQPCLADEGEKTGLTLACESAVSQLLVVKQKQGSGKSGSKSSLFTIKSDIKTTGKNGKQRCLASVGAGRHGIVQFRDCEAEQPNMFWNCDGLGRLVQGKNCLVFNPLKKPFYRIEHCVYDYTDVALHANDEPVREGSVNNKALKFNCRPNFECLFDRVKSGSLSWDTGGDSDEETVAGGDSDRTVQSPLQTGSSTIKCDKKSRDDAVDYTDVWCKCSLGGAETQEDGCKQKVDKTTKSPVCEWKNNFCSVIKAGGDSPDGDSTE